MHSSIHLMFVGLFLLAPACSAPRPQPAAGKSKSMSALAQHARPPVYLEVAGPEVVQPSSTIDVFVRIVRAAATAAPMNLCVRLPAGVSLIEGKPCEAIVDEAVGTVERRYRLNLNGMPREDINFELLQGTGPLVTRAEGAYRFGRPAPQLPSMKTNPAWKVGGRALTTPILVNPR